MIVFRHGDPSLPFLWEDASQPPGRWHAEGEGPAQYFADTPDGAWAEFLRHEEIKDARDLETVRRAIWAVELPDEAADEPKLPDTTLRGGPRTYSDCQAEARRLRKLGSRRLLAPSAALAPGGAGGLRVDGGLKPAPPREGQVVVLFGPRADLTGWAAALEARPSSDLLPRVRHS